MKTSILFCLLNFFLAHCVLMAQNPTIDSLSRLMEHNPADSTVSVYLYEKGFHFNQAIQSDSFFYYAEKLRKFGIEKNDALSMANYYNLWVRRSVTRQNFDSAVAYGKMELRWAEEMGKPKNIALGYNSIGSAFIDMGSADSAVIYLLRGLPFANKGDNPRLPVNMLYNLSAAYNMLGDYPAANDHAKKAYELAVKIKDTHAMKNSLFNWASMQVYLNNIDTALIMFHELAEMSKRDHDDFYLMDVLNNVGETYYQKKDFVSALAQYNQIAEILKKYDEPEYDLYLYANRGNTLTALGRYTESEADLGKATDLALKLNNNVLLMNVYFFRSTLAEKTNDFKDALSYWKAADSVKQKIATDDSKRHIQQLEVKYQTAQKDLAISHQQLELTNQENAIKRKNQQNLALLIGCLLLLSVVFLSYRNLRQRKRLTVRERELHQKRISELEKKHQLEAMQSILRGQEEERSRLAKDLHDGIGGLLSGVKLGLSGMQGNVFVSADHAKTVHHVIEQLDKSIAELRRVSHNMMPEALIRFGLQEALENYCENINLAGGLKVKLQTYGLDRRLNQDEEISIYRIVQELLNNVIKHADAQNVLIQLTREDDQFSLTVEDDGKGFAIQDVDIMNSAGLTNVKSRAEYLKGSVDIQSAPGQGTSVTVIGACCR